MNYLIDTHVLIWCVMGHPSLPSRFVKELDNFQNSIFVSKASLWEIAIKINLNKLNIGIAFEELETFLNDKGFIVKEFDYHDLSQLISLPMHHRDPFDRLMISQAIVNNYAILTVDKKFQQYPVQLL